MADGYDFHSPWMAVSLTLGGTDPTEIPLWAAASSDSQVTFDFQTHSKGKLSGFPFVTEASVELDFSYAPKIRVVLNPPIVEGLAFLDSPLIEWGSTTINVQFGYASAGLGSTVQSPVYSGILLAPEVTIGSDVTIVLHGQGGGAVFSALRTEGLRVESSVTPYEVVRKLLEGPDTSNKRVFKLSYVYGNGRKIDITGESGDGLDAESIEFFDTKRENYTQGSKPDWQATYDLVNATGHTMKCTGDEVTILSKTWLFGAPPTKIFRLYPGRQLGPVANVWPILEVNSPTVAVYAPGSLRAFAAANIHSQTRAEDAIVTGDGDKGLPKTAQQALPVSSRPDGDAAAAPAVSPEAPGLGLDGVSGATMFPGPLTPEVAAQMKQEYANHKVLFGVTLEVDTYGIPDLEPGEMVVADGLGERLNTNYSIHHTLTTMNSNGFTTHWTGISNAGKIFGDAVKSLGPGNKNAPPTDFFPGRVLIASPVVQDPLQGGSSLLSGRG